LFNQKVFIITGGCGFLGQHFCQRLVAENATVIIADVDEEKGHRLVRQLTPEKDDAGTGSAEFVGLDISNKENIEQVITYLLKKYGRIDALVNNAYPRNKNYGRNFFEVEYQDFCQNINLNIGGYFLCSQQFAQYFKQQGHGNIVNIASIYGVIAPKFEVYQDTEMTMPVEYAAIKSALIHLTQYMAKFLKGHNIRVNSISPGGILDAQPELFLTRYKALSLNKGMLNPEDISGTLLYLLSDAAAYVNGQNIIVDDGFTL
jgi:NAD(P)-dependent dehydrogenase (short-subunit alcohol dehydrogenase family)